MLGAYLLLSQPEVMYPGSLLAFSLLSMRLVSPLIQLAHLQRDLAEARGAISVIADVMNAPPEQSRAGSGLRLPIRGEINFQAVSFRYKSGSPLALDAVSFRIPRGSMFGIMGRSGSGKTTITRLLQGLNPTYEGIIKVDGMDLREIDLTHLRTHIGVVPQENFLFSGTIRENIAMPRPGATFAEVVRAAQMAGAEEFIERMPKGYDTKLEEGAVNLSGGQRQRLAIARALIIDPPVLVLDEATSALDAESEAIINTNLRRIAQGRTIVCISHRLSMLVPADAILVMERGQVYDIGSHDELLYRCDIYKHLWHAAEPSHAIEARPMSNLPSLARQRRDLSVDAVVSAFESDTQAVILRTSPRSEHLSLYVLLAMVFVGLVLMSVTKLDIVVAGDGRTVGTEGSFYVQPFDKGIVRAINVKVGDVVKKGEVLATLDPTFASADVAKFEQTLASAEADKARLEAEQSGQPYHPDAGGQYELLQEAIYQQRQSLYRSSVANFDAQIGTGESAIARLKQDAETYNQRLKVSSDVEKMRAQLQQMGWGSKLEALSATDARLEIERLKSFSTNQIAETQAHGRFAEGAARDLHRQLELRDRAMARQRPQHDRSGEGRSGQGEPGPRPRQHHRAHRRLRAEDRQGLGRRDRRHRSGGRRQRPAVHARSRGHAARGRDGGRSEGYRLHPRRRRGDRQVRGLPIHSLRHRQGRDQVDQQRQLHHRLQQPGGAALLQGARCLDRRPSARRSLDLRAHAGHDAYRRHHGGAAHDPVVSPGRRAAQGVRGDEGTVTGAAAGALRPWR